ncbi:MAG: bis(5'-nucleosyl)-tetraphosphatase (symmetrical) YqeK [Desulfitobacteriaceae bacterium]|nr:bis(5'-nucleosyl)-tetraphosphatase (symmetrical) YqeK [Desulfitobacteriaceae bacterium]
MFGRGNMKESMELLVKGKMSPERWQHSLGTAETAVDLAIFWKCDQHKAKLTGILHDYAREIPEDQLIVLAQKAGHQVLEEERFNPVVLHAPVGAFLAETEFGIKDREVLDAIAKHTVGGDSMSLLDKIIFLSDMIEPSRQWPGVEKLRRMVYNDIDRAMLDAIQGTLAYLKKRNLTVHPTTLLTRKNLLIKFKSLVENRD